PRNTETNSEEKPQQQQQPPNTDKMGRPTVNSEGERIEYIGNTRFPRARIRPRKTITPGEAIGQSSPAERIEKVSIKDQATQKFRDVLSPEKNLESRSKIIGEIGESYFQNILDLRKNGAKLFMAPNQLIPANKARFLPNLEGKTLTGKAVDVSELCKGKTTLLTIEFVKFAEKHTMSFISVFEQAFSGIGGAQVVQVNIEENWAKAMVLKMCLPVVRRNIPKHRHASYVVRYGGVESLKTMLGIANPLIGYAFLVDKNTRVRWYANGEAVNDESSIMVALTKELLRKTK
ncbi:hypothetical protein EV175_004853, partial [Coemansia sp. RSA 1933]